MNLGRGDGSAVLIAPVLGRENRPPVLKFLPVTAADLATRGWDTVDIVCVTGDAYVDHPSFGIAIISRVLEAAGYRVAVLAQPGFATSADFRRFGRPRLAFFITGGAVDSMVAHYTVAGKKRSDDPYTPGNRAGIRPDRALSVYTRLAKDAYPDCPVIIGGLEASLRRFAHYDCWANTVRPSLLVGDGAPPTGGADLLVYGMGEYQAVEAANGLAAGVLRRDIPGTAYLAPWHEVPADAVTCASFHKVSLDKKAYANAFRLQMFEQDHREGHVVVQQQTKSLSLVQNPPAPPLTTAEFDRIAELPYTRTYHPQYEAQGGIKALEEVEFSLIHNRGCFGGCRFCAITMHQGRLLQTRSHESLLREARLFFQSPRFKGYIHDVGGPTADFREPACQKQREGRVCREKSCLAPRPCAELRADHSDYLSLLRRLRELPGVKKVFVRSGIRFDYVNLDRGSGFLRELITHHVSGQLKVAPEHAVSHVLTCMGKPGIEAYLKFQTDFYSLTRSMQKEQYLVPYLISSHPGATLADAVELAVFLRRQNIRPRQVQDFYPTPGTVSTVMYHTGLDPYTLEEVYVPRSAWEKRLQRALLQYYLPENRGAVLKALKVTGKNELKGELLGKQGRGGGEAARSRLKKKY